MIIIWKLFSGCKWRRPSTPDAHGVVGARHDGVELIQTRGGKFITLGYPHKEWDDRHRAVDNIDAFNPPAERLYI